jgi:hypothetical protein
MPDFPTLAYHPVRLAWCRAALFALIRRWGIYLLVGVLILGGSGASALAAMSGLVAWSVLPLLHATQQSALQALLMTLAYALFGGALLWALGPLLWPRAWAEAESALPIRRPDQRASDLIVTLLGLTPLFLVYLAGVAVWWGKSPAWMEALWTQALCLLLASMGLSVVLGVALLAWRRRLTVGPARNYRHAGAARTSLRPRSLAMTLLFLPLWRGPAQRSGRFLLLSLLALQGLVAGLALWPHWTSWWLAGFAALAQATSSRLNGLIALELGGLHEACAPLPVRPDRLRLARLALALAPLLLAQGLLLGALAYARVSVQTGVLAACLAAMLLGNLALNVAASSQPRPQDAAARVSWWLLILVATIALASEVVRR